MSRPGEIGLGGGPWGVRGAAAPRPRGVSGGSGSPRGKVLLNLHRCPEALSRSLSLTTQTPAAPL